ncbi:hypothetical protein ACTA71_004498 [Dictyostelium dimigraforme]
MTAEIERGNSGQNLDKLPLFFKGSVITGFGRGSKQLGIPTANLPVEELEEKLKDIPIGVYYGWANVIGLEDNKVFPMAMSIGWNPFYKNTKKTIEIHLINKFDSDFYGAELRAIGLGFIRPMCDFKSLDELVKAINDDIDYAKSSLEKEENKTFINNIYFTQQ